MYPGQLSVIHFPLISPKLGRKHYVIQYWKNIVTYHYDCCLPASLIQTHPLWLRNQHCGTVKGEQLFTGIIGTITLGTQLPAFGGSQEYELARKGGARNKYSHYQGGNDPGRGSGFPGRESSVKFPKE